MLESGISLPQKVDAVVFGGLESGKVIRAGVDPPRVWVPDGCFEVGFEEGFGHLWRNLRLSHPFWLCRFQKENRRMGYFTGVSRVGPGLKDLKEDSYS